MWLGWNVCMGYTTPARYHLCCLLRFEAPTAQQETMVGRWRMQTGNPLDEARPARLVQRSAGGIGANLTAEKNPSGSERVERFRKRKLEMRRRGWKQSKRRRNIASVLENDIFSHGVKFKNSISNPWSPNEVESSWCKRTDSSIEESTVVAKLGLLRCNFSFHMTQNKGLHNHRKINAQRIWTVWPEPPPEKQTCLCWEFRNCN